MEDENRTIPELTKEINALRQKIKELEKSAIEHTRIEDLQRIQRDIAISLGSTSVLTDVLDRILEAAFRINGIDCGGVHVADRANGDLTLISHSKFPRSLVESFSFCPADSPRAHYLRFTKPEYGPYNEIFKISGGVLKNEGILGAAIIPVKYNGQLVAVLNLASRTYDEIPVNARTALEAIAAQIGGVIARVRIEEEHEKIIKELKKALDKVKTLSGLIPICANCKKIRDDRGYWTQVEEYVRDHSDAEFSHSICPECMKLLYPDFTGKESA